MDRSWKRIAVGTVVLLALHFHLSQLLDPWRYDGDVRQHVFWTAGFSDPELFPDDPLVRFISSPRFCPPGYRAIYAAGTRICDPLLFSKLLACALSLATGFLAIRFGTRHRGPLGGFLCVLAIGFTLFDDQRGGLPRSFAYPLVLLFLDALAARHAWRCGLSMILAALFYPPVILLMGALLPVGLLPGPNAWRSWRQVAISIGIPFAVAAAIIVWSFVLTDRAFIGPLVSAAGSRGMPEFHLGGRVEFWNPNPVGFWLGDGRYSRSSCGLLSSNTFWPLAACVLIALCLRRRWRLWREPAGLIVAGGLLFFAAHALLFHLYLPSRYPRYSWPLAFLLLAALNATPIVARPLARLPRLLAGWRGAAVFAAVLLLLLAVGRAKETRAPGPERRAVLEAVAALPKDALVAGVPVDLDDLPLHCRRSVLINRELALPYYAGYGGLVRERLEVSLELLMAEDAARVRALAQRHGVTHLLVYRDLYLPERGLRLLDPPSRERLRVLRQRGLEPLWTHGAHPFPVLHRGERWELLAIPAAQRSR